MASTSFLSVSFEAVNACKVIKLDTGSRSECSILSCAWKAPRALSGSFASTTQSRPSSADGDGLRKSTGTNRSHQCARYSCIYDLTEFAFITVGRRLLSMYEFTVPYPRVNWHYVELGDIAPSHSFRFINSYNLA
jgi:GTP pyrophosphokinase